MQLAKRTHLGKIFVCTVLDALHAIKMHWKIDALLGHKTNKPLNITINTTILVTALCEWRLNIYMYVMHNGLSTYYTYTRQCVNCVPTNSTYTKPYSSHIQLTFQGPRLQLLVQPSGPGYITRPVLLMCISDTFIWQCDTHHYIQ
jgi:hypothetical protein